MPTIARYQILSNADDDDESTPSSSTESSTLNQEELSSSVTPQQTEVISESPPPYDGNAVETTENFTAEPPPLYTDVVKLPTYNESENLEDDDTEEHNPTTRSMLWFWINNGTDSNRDTQGDQIGTHVNFLFSFLMSFIFNWIGFLVSYCFFNNLSSSYGAVAGFGLSIVKWGFLMKHHFQNQTLEESPWLFYIFVLVGWMLFLRGLIAYIQLNRVSRQGNGEPPSMSIS